MLIIEFPSPEFGVKTNDGKEYIMDVIRKKWVRLTPEEWVRQNWIQYLIKTKSYPASLLSVEKEIRLGELKKRCDVVVYKNDVPWMIVECKQPDVALSNSTLIAGVAIQYCACLFISHHHQRQQQQRLANSKWRS